MSRIGLLYFHLSLEKGTNPTVQTRLVIGNTLTCELVGSPVSEPVLANVTQLNRFPRW